MGSVCRCISLHLLLTHTEITVHNHLAICSAWQSWNRAQHTTKVNATVWNKKKNTKTYLKMRNLRARLLECIDFKSNPSNFDKQNRYLAIAWSLRHRSNPTSSLIYSKVLSTVFRSTLPQVEHNFLTIVIEFNNM